MENKTCYKPVMDPVIYPVAYKNQGVCVKGESYAVDKYGSPDKHCLKRKHSLFPLQSSNKASCNFKFKYGKIISIDLDLTVFS